MPRGDGTGPLGLGSMTGRGAGYCAGNITPGFANPRGVGRFGGRRGFRGFGWGFGYAAPTAPVYPMYGATAVYPGAPVQTAGSSADAEMNGLKSQVDFQKKSIQQLSRRIDDLMGEDKETVE